MIACVTAEPPSALVQTPAGGMRLIDDLPTRTFELTVRTCDRTVTLGQPLSVTQDAAAASMTVLGLATRAGYAGLLVLAGTGRRNLPAGFLFTPES